MRSNTKAPYIDVVMHQQARREAQQADPLAIGMSLAQFLWGLVAIVGGLLTALWYVMP